MKKYILNILIFSSVFALIIIIGVLIPPTPKDSKSLLFAEIKKDSLLSNELSPRIIFVGGSNLSFGLNSNIIKDSLRLNPINTGIHASIGLIYMINNTLNYIKSGDIVVVVPEYQQFYGNFAYGGEELLRTVLDVNNSEIPKLEEKQWLNIYKYIFKYSFLKYKPTSYFNVKESDVYSVNSFNEYGDAFAHWELKKRDFEPTKFISGEFNYSVIDELINLKRKLQEKGAFLFVTYPGFQTTSFDNCIRKITKVEIELKKNDFIILGTPNRYKIPDEMMFNTTYHLSKEGVDLRTQLLIEDITKELKN